MRSSRLHESGTSLLCGLVCVCVCFFVAREQVVQPTLDLSTVFDGGCTQSSSSRRTSRSHAVLRSFFGFHSTRHHYVAFCAADGALGLESNASTSSSASSRNTSGAATAGLWFQFDDDKATVVGRTFAEAAAACAAQASSRVLLRSRPVGRRLIARTPLERGGRERHFA